MGFQLLFSCFSTFRFMRLPISCFSAACELCFYAGFQPLFEKSIPDACPSLFPTSIRQSGFCDILQLVFSPSICYDKSIYPLLLSVLHSDRPVGHNGYRRFTGPSAKPGYGKNLGKCSFRLQKGATLENSHTERPRLRVHPP